MTRIFLKEFNAFLDSLIGYLVIGVFLVAAGLLMWVFPETSVLDYGYADMDTFFSFGPFILIFLVPAITMRSFAEERKARTLELLLTKPVTDWGVVLGKFLAAFFLVLLALVPTITYCFTLYQLGDPQGNLDAPGIVGSYMGMVLLGGVFCAIGIFASSLTPNQVVAYIIAAFLCFFFYSGLDSLSQLLQDGTWVRQFGVTYHYESLGRGLVDSRDLVYFFSLCGAMLLGAKTILSSRSW